MDKGLLLVLFAGVYCVSASFSDTSILEIDTRTLLATL